jgi:hypothetical protein
MTTNKDREKRRIGEGVTHAKKRERRPQGEDQRTSGSADQRWMAHTHGGAEARREQREEPTTGPGGQLACPVLLAVMLERPWLPTGISTRAPVIHPVRVHK